MESYGGAGRDGVSPAAVSLFGCGGGDGKYGSWTLVCCVDSMRKYRHRPGKRFRLRFDAGTASLNIQVC